MHKVLISVAPVSAADTHPDPAVIAADVIQSAREGAGQVHLHVRDLHGALTPDLTVFKETVEPIAAASDIVIQASTGGVSRLTIEERCASTTASKPAPSMLVLSIWERLSISTRFRMCVIVYSKPFVSISFRRLKSLRSV